jgi:drug/metabolite transporter (DMT)-like permease
MMFSLFLVFLAVLLTGISQVLLKIGSAHHGKRKNSVLDAYLNLPALIGYGLLLCVTVICVIALKEIPLKVLYAIASLNLVVVVGLSWGILKEKINRNMIIAIVLIFLGVIIFNI